MTRPVRLVAVAAAAVSLAGCVTLLPKSPPSQLYRFEANIPSAPATARPPMSVRLGQADFAPAAGGDEIMTVRGDEVAYIAGARWAAPAAELFEEAVEQGFDATGGVVRLAGRGVGGVQARRLRLDVIRFEARYRSGQTAPVVVVRLHAELESATAGGQPAAKLFEAEVPASANRVGDIVAAFDAATTKVVGDLVAWVEEAGTSQTPAQR